MRRHLGELAVQLHQQLLDRGAGRRGDGFLLVRVGRRDEALHMDARHVLAGRQQGPFHGIHERPRPADIELRTGVAAHHLAHFAVGEEALHRVQHVHHFQPIHMGLGDGPQLVAEDHRRLVTVGVDQLDAALAGLQRRLEDGEHRGDPRAATEQNQVVLAGTQVEVPSRWQHLQQVAGAHLVVEPVGHPAAVHPLDGDLGQVVAIRRAGHGIAARQPLATERHAEAEELPRLVAEAFFQPRRYPQHQRAAVVGLGNHLGHFQLEATGLLGFDHKWLRTAHGSLRFRRRRRSFAHYRCATRCR
ncbi:hypothetical protein D9M68_436030 [compost metagenome]